MINQVANALTLLDYFKADVADIYFVLLILKLCNLTFKLTSNLEVQFVRQGNYLNIFMIQTFLQERFEHAKVGKLITKFVIRCLKFGSI